MDANTATTANAVASICASIFAYLALRRGTETKDKVDAVSLKVDDNTKKTEAVSLKVDDNTLKTEAVGTAAADIHGKVNGNLKDIKDQLEEEKRRNKRLEELLLKFVELDNIVAKRLTASAAVSVAQKEPEKDTVPIHVFDPKHPEDIARVLTEKKPTPPQ